METGSLVTVTCSSPREKLWGVLLALSPAGATVRAVRLDGFEEWLQQQARGDAAAVVPSTVFFPAHRLERIEADESSETVESLGDRFRRLTRRDPLHALLTVGEPPQSRAASPRRRR